MIAQTRFQEKTNEIIVHCSAKGCKKTITFSGYDMKKVWIGNLLVWSSWTKDGNCYYCPGCSQ